MAENKNLTAEQDYAQNFMPGVHKIGRFTMIVAFVLSYFTSIPTFVLVILAGFTGYAMYLMKKRKGETE